MSSRTTARDSLSFDRAPASAPTFDRARVHWLIRMRWSVLGFLALATACAYLGWVPGVAWWPIAFAATAGALYNALLAYGHRRDSTQGYGSAAAQIVVDLAILTLVLWAAGGIHNPFVSYYIFHVALVAVLSGPRATMAAAAAAAAGIGFLVLSDHLPGLQVGRWEPSPAWDVFTRIFAISTTVLAAAYIVLHAARELRIRERALVQAQERAALDGQLLSGTLDQIEAGLEVVDAEGRILWRNRRAEELAPFMAVGSAWNCPGKVHRCHTRDEDCPAAQPRSEPSRCRFAAKLGGQERVYEVTVLPLSLEGKAQAGLMNLYLDRTQAVLTERQLVLAERLASLGRVTQGVAHELNTPLATVRTLAADMRVALRQLMQASEELPFRNSLMDLDESAALVQDETRRLGRITQALLAGGDLVRPQIDQAVPLAAVVERARALVFAGTKGGVEFRADASLDRFRVMTDPDRLMQVLVNLVQNSVDALREQKAGTLSIWASMEQGGVELVLDDDGPGLDPAIEGRLFEPFATTKPPGQGTGLGLYTSYMLIDAMGGRLSIRRRTSEGGTRATIWLPHAPAAASPLAEVHEVEHRAAV